MYFNHDVSILYSVYAIIFNASSSGKELTTLMMHNTTAGLITGLSAITKYNLLSYMDSYTSSTNKWTVPGFGFYYTHYYDVLYFPSYFLLFLLNYQYKYMYTYSIRQYHATCSPLKAKKLLEGHHFVYNTYNTLYHI